MIDCNLNLCKRFSAVAMLILIASAQSSDDVINDPIELAFVNDTSSAVPAPPPATIAATSQPTTTPSPTASPVELLRGSFTIESSTSFSSLDSASVSAAAAAIATDLADYFMVPAEYITLTLTPGTTLGVSYNITIPSSDVASGSTNYAAALATQNRVVQSASALTSAALTAFANVANAAGFQQVATTAVTVDATPTLSTAIFEAPATTFAPRMTMASVAAIVVFAVAGGVVVVGSVFLFGFRRLRKRLFE